MKELILRFAEHGGVTSGIARQTLRFTFRVERKAKKMALARIRSAAYDDGPVEVIQVDQLVKLEIGRRDGANKRAVG